jgi:putative hydrolase of the HAD superfamily
MVNYWRPGFEDRGRREELLVEAFAEVADRFGMNEVLTKMNPQDPPAKTLNDFYNGLIALNHQKSAVKGIEYPEVRVEEVWTVIAMMLKRNGHDVGAHVKCLAAAYNFFSMGRELYPGVAGALKKLKSNNITLGILSDAQFYTPIDLSLYFRDQSGGDICDYNELFDVDLTFFSYEYGFVKPAEILFRRLLDALQRYHITPAQTVFVGNDFSADLAPAAAAGMRTALFCGDDVMVFGVGADTVPDIVFNSWDELPGLISFHGEEG